MAKARTVFFCQSCGCAVGQVDWPLPGLRRVEHLRRGSRPEGNRGHHHRPVEARQHRARRQHHENRQVGAARRHHRRRRAPHPHPGQRAEPRSRRGLVPGSIVLIGGEPGIGKSTLMLQIALGLRQLRVLYVSGEESEAQIKMRAERLADGQHPGCYILTETNTQNIFRQIDQVKPNLVVIDSIQTMHSTLVESGAGSVSQVRECTAELLKYAKETGVPVLLIGHITKDGSIAGPKILEHMVDTVLQFEGDGTSPTASCAPPKTASAALRN